MGGDLATGLWRQNNELCFSDVICLTIVRCGVLGHWGLRSLVSVLDDHILPVRLRLGCFSFIPLSKKCCHAFYFVMMCALEFKSM
jgi:hypothetical protein